MESGIMRSRTMGFVYAAILSMLAGIVGGCGRPEGITMEPSAPVERPPASPAGPVLIYQRVLSDAVWAQAQRLGAGRCINIIGYYGDRDRDGKVDARQLREGIDEWIPHDYEGYATLDLEHPYSAWLREGPGTKHFRQAEAEMLRALREAKRLRPITKWAFWGLPRVDPFPAYPPGGRKQPLTKQPQGARRWLTDSAAAPVFLTEQDWYCVSVYDRWRDDKPWQRELQKELVGTRIQVARSIAGDKPVIACVWHRQRDGSNTLLTKSEWARDQIVAALEAGADGVCWWAHDRTSWLKPWPGSEPMPETAGMSDEQIGRYFDKLHGSYAEFLVETVRSWQLRR